MVAIERPSQLRQIFSANSLVIPTIVPNLLGLVVMERFAADNELSSVDVRQF